MAAVRPRYGGTLRVELRSGLSSLDSADRSESEARRLVESLIFEPLVRLGDQARPVPGLATSWQYDGARRRWEFTLRPGVQFGDSSELTPGAVAEVLAGFGAVANGRSVSLKAEPDLMAHLAEVPVMRRNPEGPLLGTGPFRLEQFLPNQRIVLAASDTHWAGRPYLDRVEIALRRSYRDQATDFELGRADVIEMAPEETRRASQRNLRMLSSGPAELIAMTIPDSVDARWREALALTVDRAAIQNVLLQRQGEVTGALLPGWLSGYAFLFPSQPDAARARLLASTAPRLNQPLTLAYDRNDPLTRMIADRISLNARDLGVTVRTTPEGTPGALRVLRWTAPSLDASFSLRDLAIALGQRPPEASDTVEGAWRAETALMGGSRVVPLVHVPRVWALDKRVEGCEVSRLGMLRIADAWLREAVRP